MTSSAYKNNNDYITLMNKYDSGKIDTPTFEKEYFSIWRRDADLDSNKDDSELWSTIIDGWQNKFIQIKSTLFLDLDSWVPDDEYNPDDDCEISESELRRRVKSYLEELEKHKGKW